MNTPAPGQCAQNPAIDAEPRFVTIPACSNHSGLLTVTVKLHWTCPECGGPRGDTFRTQSYDGTLPVQCDGWNNPCGHIDHYRDVRLEAQANGLNETAQNPAVDTPHAATVHFHPKQQGDAVNDFLAQIRAQEIERETVIAAGLPALQRLAKIARRDTGQAATVRLFLLGLYNGYRFPFNLTALRGLDLDLFTDCLAVLTLDARATVKEVHQYFHNGGELFEQFAEMVMEGKA
ncbi:hypothetical protein QLH52_10665 [Methylomonas sp. OY6]|uniref:DUF7673 domain-containing protein n=1 Tax=Methylomonas defluvii TaxID=3045149 RepID=A0ABU4UE34_9GAMM|nr:hypothetical protein [Methylomonas sp. OY6]MDX8127745.1 hypothetical protein [Methylomonas sp. OY6]